MRRFTESSLLLAFVALVTRSALAFSDPEIPAGCGGFVEASPALAKLRKSSDPKLDYSFVKIELHTLDGIRKHETDCAPNGYYFLPVYDKGSFVVKVVGPEGWSFEPSSVQVLVDENNQCGNGQDINFAYTGFSLRGSVLGAVSSKGCEAGAAEGPAGVQMQLLPVGGQAADAITTTTVEGGTYSFGNLLPAKYSLTASHPTWGLEGGPIKVDLTWESVEAPSVIRVKGYDLTGSVLSQGTPVLGVQVLLFTEDGAEVECPAAARAAAQAEGAQCSALTDAQGAYSFPSCPCGAYHLVPKYSSKETVFHVAPASVTVKVAHGSATVPTTFQVTGFSIGGRVVNTAGEGIAGAAVKLNGELSATSDKDGYYTLDSVTSGQYTLEASAPEVTFAPLKDVAILPNMAHIPDIQVAAYSLCGRLHMLEPRFTAKRMVALTPRGGGGEVQKMKTDADGRFCFMAAPGTYGITPSVTSAERTLGLLFTPETQEVTVKHASLSGIVFGQVRVTVAGTVQCLSPPCSSDVVVTLTPAVAGGERLTTTLGSKAGSADAFAFESLNPGRYTLEVHQLAWCWEQSSMEVEVGLEDVSGLVLKQTGYWMQVRTSHPANATLVLKGSSAEATTLALSAGASRHCVQTPGVYTVSPQGCYRFKEPAYSFDTAKPSALELQATHYQLNGKLKVEEVPADAKWASGIKVTASTGPEDAGTALEVAPTSDPTVLAYTHWATFGSDRVIVTPTSPSLLFYPRQRTVTVETYECQPDVQTFRGKDGLIIQGKVAPAIAGVEMTIVVKQGSAAGGSRAGESLRAVTNEAGEYRAGPFYDDAQYEVTALKLGYHFVKAEDSQYDFTAKRLSQLDVITGMQGVLISLSGDNRFQKNLLTGADGKLVFRDLSPGTYYLRPMLKEYSFAPANAAVEVKEGEVVAMEFAGRQVAYSVYGRVSSLNGLPEGEVSVEGTGSDRNHFEETVTAKDGSFRLRGLVPNSTYHVRVRQVSGKNEDVEAASPESWNIAMEEADQHGVDFVLFRSPPRAVLSGAVTVAEEWAPHLSLTLASAATPTVIDKTIQLPYSRYFEFADLAPGSYVVGLKCSLPKSKYAFEELELPVEVASARVHLPPLAFRAALNSYSQSDLQQQSMLPVMFAFVGVMCVAFAEPLQEALAGVLASIKGKGADEYAPAPSNPKPSATKARKAPVKGSKYT